MRQNYVKLLILTLLSGVFLFLFSPSVNAQQKITSATYYPQQKTMELLMGDFVKIAQLPNGILLVDAKNGTSKKLLLAPANIVSNGRIIQITSLDLRVGLMEPTNTSSSQEFDVCTQLVSVIVPYRSEPAKDITSLSAKVESNCPRETAIISKAATIGTVEAKEAEVLVTGAFTAVEGSGPVYVGDLKAEYDIVGDRSKTHVAPFFSLKATTAEKTDPDQFRIGVKVYRRFGAGKLPRPFTFIRAEATGELEANTEFTVKNILAKPNLQFYTKDVYLSSDTNSSENVETVVDRSRLKFIPSIGAEIGRNVRSPIARNEKAIARIVGGLSLNLIFPKTPLKVFGFKKIVWENSFTQRWFLKPEQAYKKDDNNNLQLLDFGRKPRPYFISKFNLGVNDFFAPSISYEWGEIPPLYKRIRNKVTVGFSFGFRRGVKDQ